LFCFLFVVAFVHAAEENEGVDLEKLEEDFFKSSGDLSSTTIDLANSNKEAFAEHLQQRLGVQGLTELGSEIKEFDEDGNMILKSGHKVSLKSIYEHTNKFNNGKLEDFDYGVDGKNYDGEHKAIESVEVKDGKLVYHFEEAGSISLGKDTGYDPMTREITDSEGNKIEVLGFNGEIKVEGTKYDLGLLLQEGGDDDLKGFSVIRNKDGTIVSPKKKLATGVEVPSDIKVDEIGEGMYRTFERDGKTYSVDSSGKVHEIGASSLEYRGEKMVGSNVFVSNEDYGNVYLGEDMEIYMGGNLPSDVGENYVFLGEKVNGKQDVIIHSHKGDTFYNVVGDLGTLNLEGNVFVKNGEGVIISDGSGDLKLVPLNKDAVFAHTIDKLFNSMNPDSDFQIPAGEKVTSVIGMILIDISDLQKGNGISYNAVAGSAAFQQLTAGMGKMNQHSMALVVARNFDRLGLAATEENIAKFTQEILKARDVFGKRVLLGREVDNLIYVTNPESGGRRFNPSELMQQFIAGTGQQNIQQFNGGGSGSEQGALTALANSKGTTTFFFNGHGYPSGMALGGSSISYKEMADALMTRASQGEKLSNVNIMTFACYQYDYASNLLNELANRGATEFPAILTEAGKGKVGWTEYNYFGNTRSFESFVQQNRAAGGGSFTGYQYYPSEEMSRRDDPAVFVSTVIVDANGQRRAMPLEIS